MTEEENKINNFNEDFISKEFIVKNYLGFDVNPGYEIITFIKSLDGKVEIENKGGKRVKATSLLKILSLGIHYNDKITIYCYGENQEKNLKEIEEFFKGIEVYPIEEIKENKNNKINNVVENTAKEKIMPNNDELTLNLLILGQTGVGKSSLLNALSGKKLFKTADDKEKEEKVKPTTPAGIFRQTVEIDGKKVNVYDSWGIERDDKSAKEWKELIKNELKKRGVDKDIKDWFHSVTFCISAGKNGIEYIERDIIKELLDAKYNVVIVLTQADYMISNTKEENDKFIEMIKKESGANIVIPIAANPKKSMIMTEAPKPFGLPEYKAAILVSWKKIFIDRMPLHIIEKLKRDINYGELYAPREGKDLEKLSKEIQEYFKDMLIKNTKKYIEESIKKYCSITGNMLNINQNIKIKNLDYDKRIVDFESEFADVYNDIIDFGDFVKNMHRIPIAAIKDLFGIIHFKIKGKKENIYKFICDLNKELINKISEKEFEDKIRKIIKDTLNNNIAKSIYYRIINFIVGIFNKIKKYIKKSN